MRSLIKLVLPLSLMVTACAGREHFLPTESMTALSPEGYAAAQYPIIVGGESVGQAKVWSAGAYRGKDKDTGLTRTMLHVGFAFSNNSKAPLWLDMRSIEIDSATSDGNIMPPLRPVRLVGSPDVAAGREGEVHAYFELPHGVKPGSIDSFRVRWSLHTPSGRFAQRTPFLEQRPVSTYAYEPVPFYYSPFYDPFLYPGPFANQLVVIHAGGYR